MSEKLLLTPNDVGELNNRDAKPFKSLFEKEEDLKTAFQKLDEVIWRSFAVDAQREPFKTITPTKPEIKRRFSICEAWIRHGRGDLGYSLERTLDLMGQALRAELDGITFAPEKGDRTLWTPT